MAANQVHKNELLSLDNVQWVIGTGEKMNTHRIITDTINDQEPVVQTEKIQRKPLLSTPPLLTKQKQEQT